MGAWNGFRIIGDLSHTASKCILMWAIHTNRSAEGVSLITQILYALVFVTRYLDLFWTPIIGNKDPEGTLWNFILKNFYIISSLYIIFIMMKVFARTREREKSWKLGAYCLAIAILLAPLADLFTQRVEKRHEMTFTTTLWTFSIILESVCVVPQLLLLRQTTVPTVIDSYYLLTLGSYRAFYILSWIYRGASKEHHFNWRSTVFGIIQTALYIDFAWVYWTRQRVKLRNGGVVDSDDLSRGYLVGRVLGRADPNGDDEETVGLDRDIQDDAAAGIRKAGNWGARGISVSADEDLSDSPYRNTGKTDIGNLNAPNDGLAGLSPDDDDEDTSRHQRPENKDNVGGQMWRD